MRTVTLHYDPIHAQHDVAGHPEHPGRVSAVMEHLQAANETVRYRLSPSRAAIESELLLTHSSTHIDLIRRLDQSGGGSIDPDTTVVPGSFAAAAHAAGSVLAAVDEVLGGEADASYCAVRPPGHHATRDRAMGFCLFNNVAVAASYARAHHGLKRLAIVDFDVHHGNGTQDIFWQDPDTLYVSLHQYPFYPGTGDWRERGGDRALGATVNVPLPAGSGDLDYLRTFDLLILPIVERFRPDMVLISAGYDGHRHDPLAAMELSAEAYGSVMSRLRILADRVSDGRIVAALEGGYNLEALAASVEGSIAALLEESPRIEPAGATGERIETYLEGLRRFHGLPPE